MSKVCVKGSSDIYTRSFEVFICFLPFPRQLEAHRERKCASLASEHFSSELWMINISTMPSSALPISVSGRKYRKIKFWLTRQSFRESNQINLSFINKSLCLQTIESKLLLHDNSSQKKTFFKASKLRAFEALSVHKINFVACNKGLTYIRVCVSMKNANELHLTAFWCMHPRFVNGNVGWSCKGIK